MKLRSSCHVSSFPNQKKLSYLKPFTVGMSLWYCASLWFFSQKDHLHPGLSLFLYTFCLLTVTVHLIAGCSSSLQLLFIYVEKCHNQSPLRMLYRKKANWVIQIQWHTVKCNPSVIQFSSVRRNVLESYSISGCQTLRTFVSVGCFTVICTYF